MIVTNSIRSKVLKTAHLLKNKGFSFSEAQKIAWSKYRAKQAKEVTFKKKSTGEITTRRIVPLKPRKHAPTPAKPRSKKQIATVKCMDLDKLENGLPEYACIISFHYSQVIEYRA